MMPQTIEALTDRLQQLKTKVYTNRVVSGLFTGGATGSILWSVNEPTSVFPVVGLVASSVVAIVFGVKAMITNDHYTWQRRLHAVRRQTAAKLNNFPSEPDFMLELASIRTADSEPQSLCETGDGYDWRQGHMMKFYRTLERANARAVVRFAEVSLTLDTIKPGEESYAIESEFIRIDELIGRIHEGYYYLLKAQPYKKMYDFSPAGLDQPSLQSDVTGIVRSIKKMAYELLVSSCISQVDHDHIYNTASRLEPLLQASSLDTTVRQRAMLDFELVKLEIEIYATSYMLKRHKFEASFILNNRPA